jgi:hypothetical protein
MITSIVNVFYDYNILISSWDRFLILFIKSLLNFSPSSLPHTVLSGSALSSINYLTLLSNINLFTLTSSSI